MTSIKEQLHLHCKTMVMDKIQGLEQELSALADSAASDTKSSMGDKYETSREMINLEKGKIGAQLRNAQDMLKTLNSIDSKISLNKAVLGAIVKTNLGQYFLSAPLGQVNLNDEQFFCISMASPIGRQMLGLKVGDPFQMGGRAQQIEMIL